MTTIQWFPGHMAKAIRKIKESLPKVDYILEVVDARIPQSSRNPLVNELAENKKRIIVLNKVDLADPTQTKEWIDFYNAQPYTQAIAVCAHQEQTRHKLLKLVSPQLSDEFNTVQLMVVGIPNVGKSSLINALAKRKIADVQDRPAITKRQQWVPISPKVSLLDSPGILWPKFEDQSVGKKLALTGAIKDTLLNHEDLAFYLIKFCMQYYPNLLQERYDLNPLPDTELEIIEQIGTKRGFLYKKNEVDYDKVYKMLLLELLKSKLGRITLDRLMD